MTEILIEVTSPKQLKNIECLKIIADIIKFILTRILCFLYNQLIYSICA